MIAQDVLFARRTARRCADRLDRLDDMIGWRLARDFM
jgi:hypothetical protein